MSNTLSATLFLPVNGKETWSSIMAGEVPVSEDVYLHQPIVMATTTFENGISILGGVLKSSEPTAYNIKSITAYDANGQYLQAIDVSDHEDFRSNRLVFCLGDDETVEYELKLLEKIV